MLHYLRFEFLVDLNMFDGHFLSQPPDYRANFECRLSDMSAKEWK